MAERDKDGYYIRDGILYRKERILGHEIQQLCLPRSRRSQAIRLAHETYGGHLAAKKTKARLKLSFSWTTIAADVQNACENVTYVKNVDVQLSMTVCQLHLYLVMK